MCGGLGNLLSLGLKSAKTHNQSFFLPLPYFDTPTLTNHICMSPKTSSHSLFNLAFGYFPAVTTLRKKLVRANIMQTSRVCVCQTLLELAVCFKTTQYKQSVCHLVKLNLKCWRLGLYITDEVFTDWVITWLAMDGGSTTKFCFQWRHASLRITS